MGPDLAHIGWSGGEDGKEKDMKEKKSAIIYGMGKAYESSRRYLESRYHIIGYSDKDRGRVPGGYSYIAPGDLAKWEFDEIIITSRKFFREIRDEIIGVIGEDNKGKIRSLYDAFGDFRNAEIRDKWVIERLGRIPEGKILLDAGAGEQKYKKFCPHLKYMAQDFGKYIPNEGATGLMQDTAWDYTGIAITCDITDMPLGNESVDVILCTEVFEHLKNPILAIKEFSRILRGGGELILTAPFCCLTHMAPYFYYNGFSEYWYQEHLGGHGFVIKEFARCGSYFKYMCQELFRVEDMAEKYCSTRLEADEIETIIKSMEIMNRLAGKDGGSDETLRFGSMLVAEKIKM